MEGSGSIDALKSTMEHLHWYEEQLALKKEEKPGTAALAAISKQSAETSYLQREGSLLR